MSVCYFELSRLPATSSRDNGSRDHKSHFVEGIQEQWQHDDFFGPRGYSNELDIAPEGWGIGPGESDGFQETEELFLAASQIFESVDESSEPQVDELFDLRNQFRRNKSPNYGNS